MEEGGDAVRGVHGGHLHSSLLGRLMRLPRLLTPARQLLGYDPYVHQFEIRAKRAFNGPQSMVSRTHGQGLIGVPAHGSGWMRDLVAEFKYALDDETVRTLVKEHGFVSVKGTRGSVAWFRTRPRPTCGPTTRRRSGPAPRLEGLAGRDRVPLLVDEDDELVRTGPAAR
jgi:ectoine hydroxylase